MLEQGYDGATLDRLLREWQPYWRKELGDEGYLKAFVERDEEEELLAGRFPRDVSKWSEETWEDVQAYVTWRVVKELGLHARLGPLPLSHRQRRLGRVGGKVDRSGQAGGGIDPRDGSVPGPGRTAGEAGAGPDPRDRSPHDLKRRHFPSAS